MKSILILLAVINGELSGTHVGDYDTLADCNKAAAAYVQSVRPPANASAAAMLCVPSNAL